MYRRPPLSEAVQEFDFRAESQQWQDSYWDQFARLVASEFPVAAKVESAKFRLIDPHTGDENEAETQVRRFSSSSGGFVVTMGPMTLGLSALPRKIPGGYPGWEVTHQLMLRLLDWYVSVVGVTDVERITVRYINHIPVVPGDFLVRNFVNPLSPLIPSILLDEDNPFSLDVTHTISADEQALHHEEIHLSAGNSQNSHELLLRIDEVAATAPGYVVLDAVPICRALHATAEQVFGSILNESLLNSFGPFNPLSPSHDDRLVSGGTMSPR